jgi:hypothetical protein
MVADRPRVTDDQRPPTATDDDDVVFCDRTVSSNDAATAAIDNFIMCAHSTEACRAAADPVAAFVIIRIPCLSLISHAEWR